MPGGHQRRKSPVHQALSSTWNRPLNRHHGLPEATLPHLRRECQRPTTSQIYKRAIPRRDTPSRAMPLLAPAVVHEARVVRHRQDGRRNARGSPVTEESQRPRGGILAGLAGSVLPEQAEEPVGDDRAMGKVRRGYRPQARAAGERNAVSILRLLHPQPWDLNSQI